mmetsp:Transcript_13315/g.20277  ORF Transcript_13315/g.20277 Transcript_13315/m.20277 type:complete len:333 (-) Transcript_13315:1476-2474(-)
MKVEAFKTWCSAQGISSPLQVQGFDTPYRFATCNKELVAGESLFQIPLESCLTGKTQEEVAEKLMFEKKLGAKSQYASYLNVLPKLEDMKSMPLFWNEKRLSTVADGGQLEQMMSQNKLKGVDPWAFACVKSRTNFLADSRIAMTPLLDMINHNPTMGTKAEVIDDKLSLHLNETISSGAEVCISYGDLTNLETLCTYGFILPDNPCNTETVDMRIIRRGILPITIQRDGSIDDFFLSTMRYTLATDEELSGLDSKDLTTSNLASLSKPLSKRNEEEVLCFMLTQIGDAATESRDGAIATKKDNIVSTYLTERASSLERGLAWVENKLENLV